MHLGHDLAYVHHHSHSLLGSLFGLVLVLVIFAVLFTFRRRGRNRYFGGPPPGGPPPGGYAPPGGPTAWGNPHASYPQTPPLPAAGQDVYDSLRNNPYGTGAPAGQPAPPPAGPPPAAPAAPPPPPRQPASGEIPPGWGGQANR